MTNSDRQMHLGAFINTFLGHHLAAWRHPDVEPNDITNLQFYKKLAQTAERGKFDVIFVADSLTIMGEDMQYGPHIRIDPFILLSALASVTEHIGLVPTVSTSYNEPFHVARKLSSLDHLSNGRAGWNVVTSSLDEEAQNFGRETHYDHSERYEIAQEFVELAKKLWDGWEDGAIIANKETGEYIDPNKLHHINHKGKYFSVKGPLNVPRSPQGYPVIVQAGASERGREFAAQTAEVFFTISPSTLEEGQAAYADMKRRLVKNGRSEDDLKIMPGVVPFVGKTEEEAKEKYDTLQELILPQLGLTFLSKYVGADLSAFPLDGPLPELPEISEINMEKGRYQVLADLSKKEGLTIKELGRRFANNQGHLMVIGSAEQVADKLEEWFVNKACDGFNVKFPHFPGAVDDFVDLVIPELQKRGLFRTEYTGQTLRENLGLKRPAGDTKVFN